MLLRQIRYFVSVVKNNSFTEAAEECFISQSAISQQVHALEADLGVQLLVSENRGFSLTPDEVAAVADLLMSDRGAFITGSDFLIDGGVTASYWYGDLAPEKK